MSSSCGIKLCYLNKFNSYYIIWLHFMYVMSNEPVSRYAPFDRLSIPSLSPWWTLILLPFTPLAINDKILGTHRNIKKDSSTDITNYEHSHLLGVASPVAVHFGEFEILVRDGSVCAVDHVDVSTFLKNHDVVLVVWMKLESNNRFENIMSLLVLLMVM